MRENALFNHDRYQVKLKWKAKKMFGIVRRRKIESSSLFYIFKFLRKFWWSWPFVLLKVSRRLSLKTSSQDKALIWMKQMRKRIQDKALTQLRLEVTILAMETTARQWTWRTLRSVHLTPHSVHHQKATVLDQRHLLIIHRLMNTRRLHKTSFVPPIHRLNHGQLKQIFHNLTVQWIMVNKLRSANTSKLLSRSPSLSIRSFLIPWQRDLMSSYLILFLVISLRQSIFFRWQQKIF